jgi:hypothetical protein
MAAVQAQGDEIERQRTDAARAQAELDRQNAEAAAQASAIDTMIDRSASGSDGPVPQVLLDTWGEIRKARGLQ